MLIEKNDFLWRLPFEALFLPQISIFAIKHSMSGFKMLPQKVFDQMVIEVKDSTPGMTLQEAVAEAKAIFEEEYSLEGLYIVGDEDDAKQKQKLETNLATVERCALGQDTQVNCTFAFQGLIQTLTNNTNELQQRGSWRLVESRRLVRSLVKLLQVGEDEKEGGGAADAGEDDDDDEEDAEEDRTLFLVSVLELLLLIQAGGAQFFWSAESSFVLLPELYDVLMMRLDESMSEKRIAVKLLQVLSKAILPQPENKAALLERGLAALLETTKRFHAKDSTFGAAVDSLLLQ